MCSTLWDMEGLVESETHFVLISAAQMILTEQASLPGCDAFIALFKDFFTTFQAINKESDKSVGESLMSKFLATCEELEKLINDPSRKSRLTLLLTQRLDAQRQDRISGLVWLFSAFKPHLEKWIFWLTYPNSICGEHHEYYLNLIIGLDVIEKELNRVIEPYALKEKLQEFLVFARKTSVKASEDARVELKASFERAQTELLRYASAS